MNRAHFTSPAYLLRIKAAILAAVRLAPANRLGVATAMVRNAHGKPSLLVAAHAGKGFEVLGGRDLDDDVTALALAGLRAYHAGLKQAATKTVHLALPGLTGGPGRLRPSAIPKWPCPPAWSTRP